MLENFSTLGTILFCFLLLIGSFVTFLSSLGLLFFSDFHTRIHAPILGSTLGAICILLASIIFFFCILKKILFGLLMVIILLIISSPVTAMLLMHVDVYRKSKKKLNSFDA